MSQSQLRAKVVRNDVITPDIKRMTLAAPEIAAAARPGQFVMVRVSDGLDPVLRRPFSIHQIIGERELQILYKVVGKGTAMLARKSPGETLDLIGPLGSGFAMEQDGKKACLVGGGMGIAPLYFLAKDFLRSLNPREVMVLLGARTADEIKTLASDFTALGINQVHVATDDGSYGHHGLVLDLMHSEMPDASNCKVYSCGPHPMLKAVANFCKSKNCVGQVSLETMMACGIGACLGCAIPRAGLAGDYLHVCKDGPVFDANEVAWL